MEVDPYRYALIAYGMSAPSPRRDMPAGFKRFYDRAAPSLGLALTAEALRRTGAKEVLFPGTEYARDRKSYKRPEMREILRRTVSAPSLTPDERVAVETALKDWDKLSEERLHAILSNNPHIRGSGFPPGLIERYYDEIPLQFKGNRIMLKGPLRPNRMFPFYSLDLEQFRPLEPFFKREAP
jgi:hypothetical protein